MEPKQGQRMFIYEILDLKTKIWSGGRTGTTIELVEM